MLPDSKEKLLDPEQYINFIHHQDIENTTCHEDLKTWCRYTNIACLQIEGTKFNKSDEGKQRLEEIWIKGVKTMQRLGKKMRELNINPA